MAKMPDAIDFDPDGDVVLILLDSDQEDGGEDDEDIPSESSGGADSADHQPEEVRMRVSSRHLTLVSPVFAGLLKGGFAESHALSSAGMVEISLPDDDPRALQVLLNIIHGHLKKVPREVEVGLLTQMAVLIDKYCLHEVAEVFSDMWFERLKGSIPQSFTDELMPWLCISWVFRKREAFKITTKLAMQEGDGDLTDGTEFELPIPAEVCSMIDLHRKAALSECQRTLHTIETTYQGPDQQCKREEHCDAMVLGVLLKALQEQGLRPFPNSPFTGLSFMTLKAKLSQMSFSTLCESIYPRSIGRTALLQVGHDLQKICGIKRVITNLLRTVEDGLQGLEFLSDS